MCCICDLSKQLWNPHIVTLDGYDRVKHPRLAMSFVQLLQPQGPEPGCIP
jgi:hypothetical protein